MAASNLYYAGVSLGEDFKVRNFILGAYAAGGLRNQGRYTSFIECGLKMQLFSTLYL